MSRNLELDLELGNQPEKPPQTMYQRIMDNWQIVAVVIIVLIIIVVFYYFFSYKPILNDKTKTESEELKKYVTQQRNEAAKLALADYQRFLHSKGYDINELNAIPQPKQQRKKEDEQDSDEDDQQDDEVQSTPHTKVPMRPPPNLTEEAAIPVNTQTTKDVEQAISEAEDAVIRK